MLKKRQPLFILFVGLLLAQTGYAQKRDFSYMGELPELKFQVLQINEGDIALLDADSLALENRIYIMLDEQAVIKINNHAITWSSFPRVIEYVITNPDQREGLPAKVEDAVICTNVSLWQPESIPLEEVQFRKQYLQHWISRVYFDEIQTLIGTDWGVNWEQMDTLALDTIIGLLSPRLAFPDAPLTEQDLGISIKLPPWNDDEPDLSKLKARNILSVLVNAKGEILVRAERTALDDVRQRAKTFILNPEVHPDLAESPKNAVISLQNERQTSYKTYLAVYNELKGAYEEIWEEAAQSRYGKPYAELSREEQQAIKQDIPFVISESEPTNFGEE